MKRRSFAVAGVLAVGTPWVAHLAQAQGGAPVAGTQYLPLGKLAPVDTPKGKIEVIEFFWYNCPHCNAFEPTFDPWSKQVAKDVVVKRVPVAFNDSFVPQQRLFYSLEALGKLPEMHGKVFNAIHTERQDLRTPEKIEAWIEKQGVDKAKFLELFNSFSVSTKVRKALQLQEAYKVAGVPALGIAGRFYTDGDLAGSIQKALGVTEFLIAEVRKGH